MMTKKTQILKPVGVSPVCDEPLNRDETRGCWVKVYYDGLVTVKEGNPKENGFFNVGYGCTYNCDILNEFGLQTAVQYFFHESPLWSALFYSTHNFLSKNLPYPASLARAEIFKESVEKAITDFIPTDVSEIGMNHRGFYGVKISYPSVVKYNPLFNQYIRRGKPKIYKKIPGKENVQVVYVFGKDNIAYTKALNFQSSMRKFMVSNTKER